MIQIKKNIISLLKVATIASFVLVGASFSYAVGTWTPPTAPFGSNNVDAPIHKGIVTQSKSGSLAIFGRLFGAQSVESLESFTAYDKICFGLWNNGNPDREHDCITSWSDLGGMPTGGVGDTIRHDGTNWVRDNFLKNKNEGGAKGVSIGFDVGNPTKGITIGRSNSVIPAGLSIMDGTTASEGRILAQHNDGSVFWTGATGAMPTGAANETLRYDAPTSAWKASGLMKNDESTVLIERQKPLNGPPQVFNFVKNAYAQINNSADLFSAQMRSASLPYTYAGVKVNSSGDTIVTGPLSALSVASFGGTATFGAPSLPVQTNIYGKLKVQGNGSQPIAEFLGNGDVNIKPNVNAGQVTVGAGSTQGLSLRVDGNIYAQVPSSPSSNTGWIYTDQGLFNCGQPVNSGQFDYTTSMTADQAIAAAAATLSGYNFQTACSSYLMGTNLNNNTFIQQSNTSCSDSSPSLAFPDCDGSDYSSDNGQSGQAYLFDLSAQISSNGSLPVINNPTQVLPLQLKVKRFKLIYTQVTGSQGKFIGSGATLSDLANNNNSNVCADANGRLITCSVPQISGGTQDQTLFWNNGAWTPTSILRVSQDIVSGNSGGYVKLPYVLATIPGSNNNYPSLVNVLAGDCQTQNDLGKMKVVTTNGSSGNTRTHIYVCGQVFGSQSDGTSGWGNNGNSVIVWTSITLNPMAGL